MQMYDDCETCENYQSLITAGRVIPMVVVAVACLTQAISHTCSDHLIVATGTWCASVCMLV